MNLLRVALCQINPVVGDIRGNLDIMRRRREEALALGAEVVVFPEMALTGYPAEDLLLKSSFVARSMDAVRQLASETGPDLTIIGAPWHDGDLYNAAVAATAGTVVGAQRKRRLPNYGVFDENRYFRPGHESLVLARGPAMLGPSVCEDIWYPDGPPAEQALYGGANVLINISASPFHQGKGAARERMLAVRAADTAAFVVYCNLVGGQDELVFDGQSLVFGPRGDLLARAAAFAEQVLVLDLDLGEATRACLADPARRQRPEAPRSRPTRIALPHEPPAGRAALSPPVPATPLDPLDEVMAALVAGTRDYVRKSGFAKAVVGLSGGVDSALTALVAEAALGPDNVVGVAMPSRYSSPASLDDARTVAENLGVAFLVAPIDAVFTAFCDVLAGLPGGRPEGLTEENIQPRVRGTLLMALSNRHGWLVLTTGNKSEVGVGYCTLYGDTAGGFAVLKDVPKTMVYALCRRANALAGREVVPAAVLDKPPSAELRPDQKDSDSLPDYAVLDPILEAYVGEGLDPRDIAARGFAPSDVARVVGLVDRNEYKRRQSPPGVKISTRAFGKDWRLPLVSRHGR